MGRLRFTHRKRKQTQNQNQKPKKWTMAGCARQINAMVNKYECLTKVLTQCDKEELAHSLFMGYRLTPCDSRCRQPLGIPYFTLDDLKDRQCIDVANRAIREHNKNVEDDAKLAFEELIYFYTKGDCHGFKYICYLVARKLSDDELNGYCAVLRTPYSDGKEVLTVFNPLGQRIGEDSSEEDESIAGNSCSTGTPERSFGNASKEESESSCEKERQTDSFMRMKSDSISVSLVVAGAMEQG